MISLFFLEHACDTFGKKEASCLFFELFFFVFEFEYHVVVYPFAFEFLSLFVLDAAFAVHFVLEPITLITGTIRPNVNAWTVSLIVLVVA